MAKPSKISQRVAEFTLHSKSKSRRLGEIHAENSKHCVLLGRGRGDPTEPNLAAIGHRQNDVYPLHCGQEGQRSGGRRLDVVPTQEVFQRHPERVAEKRHRM